MVGRSREEQVVERLRKPVNGTVVGELGLVDGTWATRELVRETGETWTLSSFKR
jgi:hypothetical protein